MSGLWNFLISLFGSDDSNVYFEKVRGTRIKGVVCEKCGAHYAYRMERVGEGKYFWNDYDFSDPTEAENEAKQEASRDLEDKLRWGSEVAPCPKCHWVQKDMILGMKRLFDINSHPSIRDRFVARAMNIGLWTKEQVEAMRKQSDCELDCSYALLDWEREKLSRSESASRDR